MSPKLSKIANALDKATQSASLSENKITALTQKQNSLSQAMDIGAGKLDRLNFLQKTSSSAKRQAEIDKLIIAQDKLGNSYTQVELAIKKENMSLDQHHRKQAQLRSDLTKANKELNKTTKGFESFTGKIVGAVAGLQLFQMISRGIKTVVKWTNELVKSAEAQQLSENKLATIMRQRMGVTDDAIQSVIDYTGVLQQSGIIGDEVAIAGLQQASTFLTNANNLKVLAPAMNNLIAHQKGINATQSDAVNIGNMLGKVLTGQVGALTRVGITFSEAEKKALKYGNEQQRVATLVKVIENNIGNMNTELAKTPSGAIKALSNNMGDLGEKVGQVALNIKGAFAMAFMSIFPNIENTVSKFTQFFIDHSSTIITVLAVLGSAAVVFGAVWLTSWLIAGGPVTLIVLDIITIIWALIAVINTLGATTQDVTAFIGGTFNILSAVINNAVAIIYNIIASLAEFLAYVFQNPLKAVSKLFYDVFIGVLSIIEVVAGAIGSLFGQDWSSGISSMKSALQNQMDELYSDAPLKIERMEMKNIEDERKRGAKTGREFGANLENGLNDLGKKGFLPSTGDLGDALDEYSSGDALNTKVRNKIEIKDEDLKMLNDIAMRDYQLNYKQVTPQVKVSIDTVAQTTDVNMVIEAIQQGISETVNTNLGIA